MENEIELHQQLENVEIVNPWKKLQELIEKENWAEIDKFEPKMSFGFTAKNPFGISRNETIAKTDTHNYKN